jgi:hypothetical protein
MRDVPLSLKILAAVATVAVPIVAVIALVSSGPSTPSSSGGASSLTRTPTVSSSPPAPATSAPATSAPRDTPAPVYYQGLVGIGQNGRDFDSNPPGPGSIYAAFLYGYNYPYGLTTISSTGGFAVWPQGGTPTASECKTWATTHLTSQVSNVVAGMQICFETDQGRFGLLSVKPGTTAYELNAFATVWGS